MTPPSPYRERVVYRSTLQTAVSFVTVTTLWLAARGVVGCPPPHCREGFRHGSASGPHACFPSHRPTPGRVPHLERSTYALLGAPEGTDIGDGRQQGPDVHSGLRVPPRAGVSQGELPSGARSTLARPPIADTIDCLNGRASLSRLSSIAVRRCVITELLDVCKYRQLFLDDHAIESNAGVVRRLHQPDRHGHVLKADRSRQQTLVQRASVPQWKMLTGNV